MAPSLWKRDATEVRKHAGSSKHFLLYYITGIFSFEVSLTTILLYSPKANAIWLSSLKIFLPPDDLTYCCQVGLSNFCLTFSFSSLQIKTGSSCLMGSVPNFSPLLSQFSITQHEPVNSPLFFVSYSHSLTPQCTNYSQSASFSLPLSLPSSPYYHLVWEVLPPSFFYLLPILKGLDLVTTLSSTSSNFPNS